MSLADAIAASESVTAYLRSLQNPGVTPAPITPPPVVAPQVPPAPAPPQPGYRNTQTLTGVFPSPRGPNQRQYTQGLRTDDLLVVAFNAPAGAPYLGIAVSAQGGQRIMQWSVSSKPGDFSTPYYTGNGVDLALMFATVGGGRVIPAGGSYFNLRFDAPLPSEEADVVVFFQRPA